MQAMAKPYLIIIGALLATACTGGSGDSAPTKPDVAAGPGPAVRLVIRTQPSGATVGQPMLVQPVVELQDARGATATSTSASVTIRVTDGATTTLSGQTTVSAVAGVATFSGLGLTGTAGSKTLEVSAPGLESATSAAVQLAAGAPKALVLATAPSATAMVTVPLVVQPVLQAVDMSNNPTAFAATVTAAVDSGPGTILNGATASTDGNGRVSFSGFSLGGLSGTIGLVRVRLTAPGVDPAEFRVRLTCFAQPFALGTTVVSAVSAGDCTFTSGTALREFTVTSTQPVNHLRVSMTAGFQPRIFTRASNAVGTWYWGQSAGADARSMSLDLLSAAGTTSIAPGPALPGTTGAFSIRAEALSGDIACIYTLVTGPITTTQRLAPGDCGNSSYYGDYFYIGVAEGATLSATVSSPAFRPYVAIYRASNNELLAFGSGIAAASTAHVNTGKAELFSVYVSNSIPQSFGAYTLAINQTAPAGIVAQALPANHPANIRSRPSGSAPVFTGFPPVPARSPRSNR
jgi:hypothetical protein